ncbi:hypothetical protein [Altericista sp. CCNU0014]
MPSRGQNPYTGTFDPSKSGDRACKTRFFTLSNLLQIFRADAIAFQ